MGKRGDDVVHALDGHDFKQMVFAGLSWLQHHQAAINALNVFPVPDGDTGTNMTLTMTSAWDEIANFEEENVGAMVSKMAHGALMGARGNSGVILSQIWRGFARSLDSKVTCNVEDMVLAMREASETAYKGVVKPVEGTILTVVRDVAEETAIAALETHDMVQLAERMVLRAKTSVAHTPALLPVLRQAGVVDSGGQGFLVILEGMLRYLKGVPITEDVKLAQVVDLDTHPQVIEAHGVEGVEFDSAYPYDVQFIIVGQDMPVDEIRMGIEELGDCPLTVGDSYTIKVHVHVADPGIPISFGAKWGSLRDVVVEDMQAQYQEFISGRDQHPVLGPDQAYPAGMGMEEAPNIAVVVVAAGNGLARVFLSLGATGIIEGGQTMNPSTAQILEAVEQVASDKVIILPNNKNILLAAQQASEVCAKEVVVVPTRNIPQGISALLTLDQSATLDGNVSSMLRAMKEVTTCEVTWATRNVALNGIEVREGDAIGLLEGELVVDATSFGEAVHWLLAEAELEDRELVTLYYGADVEAVQAQTLADDLADAYPDLEFEVVEGLQPHYPYIISIE